MSYQDDNPAIVIDNGTSTCKAGFAGDDAPRSVFPTIVGRPKYDKAMVKPYRDSYVGNEAEAKRGKLVLKHPIQKGVVVDWDDMELVWQHAFQELRVESDAAPVLLTDSVLNPKANREKMVQIMFEKFGTPGCHVCVQSLLTLYASGRGVGIMLDCGAGGTQVVPVHQGYTIPNSFKSLDVSGMDITEYLCRILNERGYSFDTTAERKVIVKDMKEELCYVAEDFHEEMKTSECSSALEREYELPDGNIVQIGNERFRAPECLFTPSLIGKEVPGVHEQINSCLKSIDIDLRRDFYTNIIISGGSTMFPGFEKRLTKEMKKLIPDKMIVKVVAPPERKYSVWIGGSMLASLSTFQERWVTKQEYEEKGPRVIHEKACL